MLLVVGLGNPGPKYEKTRHNVGFMVLDRVARALKASPFRDKFSGVFTRVSTPDVALLKPLTFMNSSGESVQQAMRFFKLGPEDILVVYDELDLPFGDVRLKRGGGAAGHNGVKSMIAHCGGDGFARLRVGIGKPSHGEASPHVLGEFSSAERAQLEDVLDHAALGVHSVIDKGIAQAMNAFNTRKK
jgi:PTH1 family peptidyl-tRNA hydrolase